METQEPTSLRGTRLLRLPRVMDGTGMRRSSIYARIKAGTFPSPIPLGGRAVAWSETEINKWIEDRIAAARGGEEGVNDAR